MIRIAVCDDNITVCSEIENLVENICTEKGLKYEFEPYTTGERLIKSLSNGENFDLIFLDIELDNDIDKEKYNGVKVGNLIRSTLNNHKVEIVYVSSKTEYNNLLFANDPLNFLEKPITYEKIKMIIEKYMAKYDLHAIDLVFSTREGASKIRMRDIIYVSSAKRMVTIHTTTDEEVTFYGRLDEIFENQLKHHNFIRTHKSYAANPINVKEFLYESFIMSNGDELPVSKDRRKTVRETRLRLHKEGKL